jgi:hypothetical protein
MDFPSGSLVVVSTGDLTARAARLLRDLADNVPVPAKHAADYLRLVEIANQAEVKAAWRDHRKPAQPADFGEVRGVLRRLIPARSHLLLTPEYSQNTGETCPRCVPTAVFPLAHPQVVLRLLGYC